MTYQEIRQAIEHLPAQERDSRVWQTEFAISRRERYHGIFCELVPKKLNA